MVFGNSISNQSKMTYAGGSTNFPVSAVRQFNSLMQHAFIFDDTGDGTIGGQALSQGVWGYSGGTSTQMVPYIAACLAAYRPGVVFLHLFENDILSLTLADSYTNLKTAIRACKDAGAIPVVFSCLPSMSYTTTAHRDYFGQLNDLIFEECAKQAGAIAVDVSGAYIDTANTYPQPLSGYIYGAPDNTVHPNVKGNIVLSGWIYDQIAHLFHRPKYRVNGKMDGNAILSAIPNPCMAGTTGTLGTNATGASGVAASWTASAVGTAGMAVVCSKVADGTKFSQNLAGSFSGTAAVSGDTTYFYNDNATTGWAIGDKIYLEIEVEITGTPIALKSVYGYVNMTGTSEILYTENFQGSADAGFGGVYPVGRYVLRSPLYAIPAGTTGLRNYIAAKYNTGVASGSFNLIVHSAVVRKVPTAQA